LPTSDPSLNTQSDGVVDAPVRQVVVFFVITHAFTWASFLAAKPVSSGPRPS